MGNELVKASSVIVPAIVTTASLPALVERTRGAARFAWGFAGSAFVLGLGRLRGDRLRVCSLTTALATLSFRHDQAKPTGDQADGQPKTNADTAKLP